MTALREAVAYNVDSAVHLLDFLRKCSHAGLMHLSTCYVVGMRDGRVGEALQDNYTPAQDSNFDAQREVDSLREMIGRIEARSESPELTRSLRRQVLGRADNPSPFPPYQLYLRLKPNPHPCPPHTLLT